MSRVFFDFSIDKDPSAKLTYTRDWSRELDVGVTLSASVWAVSGPTVDATPLVITSAWSTETEAFFHAEAGTAGADYLLTNHITKSDGTEDERTFRIRVRQL